MPIHIQVSGGPLGLGTIDQRGMRNACHVQRRLNRRSGTMVLPQAVIDAAAFVEAPPRPQPWFPTTCGDGLYPCNQGEEDVPGAFGNLSGTIGCSELDSALVRLGAALKVAASQGKSGSPTYVLAQAFHEEQDSWWRGKWFASNETCRNLVAEANQHISALDVGVGQVEVDISKGAGATDYLGTVKTAAIAAGIIAAVVVVAPIVWEVIAEVKAARKAR